jgi:amidase
MHLSDLDATAQAELVRSGTATPRELVDAAIARIERHNSELGAVIIPLFEQARATADDAPHGPFRGVPILIKDIIATVGGVLYTAGLKPLREAHYTSPVDSHLVASLRRAGFVIVGKTNTSEFGIVPSAEPPAWPPARNPYDTARSTGGSSGGSAAAVASGMVPVAHANDGGGSIRIPASCCGLYGLKPSRGRISFAPNYGDINGGLVNEHVVARSVRDSAAILDLLAGMQPGDPYTAPAQLGPYAAELAVPPGKLRIGYATRRITPDGTFTESHPDCIAAVEHTAKLLAALGHTVEPAEMDTVRDPGWVPNFLAVWAVGVTHDIEWASQALGRPVQEREGEPLSWGVSGRGSLVSGRA